MLRRQQNLRSVGLPSLCNALLIAGLVKKYQFKAVLLGLAPFYSAPENTWSYRRCTFTGEDVEDTYISAVSLV